MKNEPSPPERLSIAHLLLWTAMSAVLLGYQRAITSLSNEQTLFSTTVTLVYAPLFGAGLGACVLSFWRLTQGGPRFPAQPGHWLLIIGGIGALISLVFQTVSVMALAGVTSYKTFIFIRLVELLALAVVYGIATWRVPGARRLVFLMGIGQATLMATLCMLTLLSFDDFFFKYFRYVELALSGIIAIAILVMAIVDRVRHEPRDYLHWTGVAARLIYSAPIIAIPWLFQWLRTTPG